MKTTNHDDGGLLPAPVDLAMRWINEEAEVATAGSAGHDVTFKTACTLVNGFELGDADLQACLEHYNATKCVPPWNHGELQHKLSSARNAQGRYKPGWLYRKMCWALGYRKGGQGQGTAAGKFVRQTVEPKYEPRWKLNFDLDALRRVQPTTAWTAERLMRVSPVPVAGVGPAEFLTQVFGPQAMVLVFTVFGSQGQYMLWRGRVYRLASRPGVKAVPAPEGLPKGGKDGVWYLSQPVDGKWHANARETDAGGRAKMSRRSEESVRAWQHMVLEADPVEEIKRDARAMAEFENLWLGFLARLPLPIKAIYTSGGKSVHALVHLPAETKERFDNLKKVAGPLFSKLGADPRALKAVQLTRLPGCLRGNREQKLLYLNPGADLATGSIDEERGML